MYILFRRNLTFFGPLLIAPEDYRKKLDDHLASLLEERTKSYLSTTVTVTRLTESASITTTVNFAEGRRHVAFVIKPPFGDLLLLTNKLNLKQERGEARRVRRSVPKPNPDGSVQFEFTLIEPDAVEPNVYVRYDAEVSYKFSPTGARAKAAEDLLPVGQDYQQRMAAFAAEYGKPAPAPVPPPKPMNHVLAFLGQHLEKIVGAAAAAAAAAVATWFVKNRLENRVEPKPAASPATAWGDLRGDSRHELPLAACG